MKVFQSNSFARKVKKFNKGEKLALDETIKKIIADPSIGIEKRGDLKGVMVHKFKIQTSLYLVSYQVSDNAIELITIGPHENYYRELKAYLKGSP